MKVTGRCYCGDVKYEVQGDPLLAAQCHCRECQYITGGGPNFFVAMPVETFHYTQGQPKGFQRSDIDNAVTREFCPNCGTHLLTRAGAMPNAVIVKAGTMDDPSLFPTPQMAIFCIDKQAFHAIPENVPQFDRVPG